MCDKLIVKLWHGGKIARNNKWKYVGGECDMFEVEIDKCSYFELTDYVVEFGKYTNKEFCMFYLLPGKPLEVGLVELKNDSDVMKMLTDLGDDIKHICSLYVEAQPPTIAAHDKAHVEGQQSPPSIPTSLIVVEPQSEGDTFENEEGSDKSDSFDEESERDDLVCSESDTEDEEWRKFVCSIVEVNKEDQLTRKQLIENLGQHTSEEFNSIVVQEGVDSSYEDSDAEVNSPGESEDDDILCRNAEEFVHEYYTKEMYMKAYEFTIPPLPSEKFWPRVDLPLDPPPIKVQLGRPKKNRKKDPHEDPKKPGKLSKHGQLKACSICKSKAHNKRTCTLKDKPVEAPVEPTRKRGRQAQASRKGTQVETAPVSQPKRKRGRPKKTQSNVELP
ncbi:hypothetical protein SSX86_008552 [Deinandra increscens subsp. villosa]|uniref:PB1-like domain-containing protein n=1 Tax=Deinandra increscens subsp. villosa TaxID=3103831 RepID=A0AAP0H6X6_9ASTR